MSGKRPSSIPSGTSQRSEREKELHSVECICFTELVASVSSNCNYCGPLKPGRKKEGISWSHSKPHDEIVDSSRLSSIGKHGCDTPFKFSVEKTENLFIYCLAQECWFGQSSRSSEVRFSNDWGSRLDTIIWSLLFHSSRKLHEHPIPHLESSRVAPLAWICVGTSPVGEFAHTASQLAE